MHDQRLVFKGTHLSTGCPSSVNCDSPFTVLTSNPEPKLLSSNGLQNWVVACLDQGWGRARAETNQIGHELLSGEVGVMDNQELLLYVFEISHNKGFKKLCG